MAQREYQRIVSLCLQTREPEQDIGDVIEVAHEISPQPPPRRKPFETAAPSSTTGRAHAPAGHGGQRLLRRVFDATCAAAGLAILAPLFAAVAVAIKLDDGGPVFYSHFRIGQDFREFRLFKFRSMVSRSAEGSTVTSPRDARITRVGRFLRKYKLDELPQLVNVLKGEMELVGTRPQMERFVEMFRAEYEELLRTPPGITDLASLAFRNEERLFQPGSIEEQYITRIMPAKSKISLDYSRSRTFLSDLAIVFRTVLGLPSPSKAREEPAYTPAVHPISKFVSRNSL